MGLRNISGMVWCAIILAVALLFGSLLMPGHKAAAGKCLPYGNGFYTGNDYSCAIQAGYIGDPVSPGTFSSGDTNKSSFISAALSSGASAFYVQLMSGQTNVTTWENEINSSSIGIRVQSVSDGENSLHWIAGTDGLPADYVFFQDGSPQSVPSLVFYNTQTSAVYTIIKIDCGNPLNELALPKDQPPVGSVALTCNADGTGEVKLSFSDPDGNTSAKLTVKYASGSSGSFSYGTSGSYTRAISAPDAKGNWSASLLVNDNGGSQNKTYNASSGNCDKPPTGSFVSVTCNPTTEEYTISAKWGDPNGATQAELTNSGGTIPQSQGGGNNPMGVGSTSATWIFRTTDLPTNTWPLQLRVQDSDGGALLGYQTAATYAFSASANCNPVGSIKTMAGTCDEVSFSLWDPNDPTDTISYYLDINGTKDAGSFAKGQNGGTTAPHLYNYAGFDQWSPSNSVTLIGVDNQTHGQVNLATVTFNTPCATPVCGSSSVAGQTYAAGSEADVQVWMNITSTAQAPPTYGPKSSDFSSIVFETLNEKNYAESYGSGELYSTPMIKYYPPSFYDNTISYAFYDGENHTTYPCNTAAPTKVVYEPYYTVDGGDVSAGQGFEAAGGGGCTSAVADVAGYNAGASDDYFGAGTRQAAIATGNVDQFATDMTNADYTNNLGGSTDGLSAHMPSGLAFSNTGMAAGMYGGSFMKNSSQQWCVPNYYASYSANASSTAQQLTALPANWGSLSSNTSYVIRISGNATITSGSANPITIPVGTHVTILDNTGSIYIKSDIKYAGFSNQPTLAQTLADIPQLNLLVNSGNIFIDPGVGELHGLYVAQPGAANTGEVVTCGNGYSYPGNVIKDYNACSAPAAKTLTIYGAVSAGQIIPGRTLDNIVGTSAIANDPAEQFVFTPELWLGSTTGPSTSCAADESQTACTYQSYTSLPPVL